MNDVSIFAAAVDKADPAERTAYLNEVCRDDVALRGRVESLLAAHERAGDFLERPAVEATQAHPDRLADTRTYDSEHGDVEEEARALLEPSTKPGALGRIGQYDVLEVLGRGGFGIVYRAFDDVLQRVVAVKVLAPRMATTSPARKRFLREARSSAAVRHENVVQVYAVVELPFPYLVMEYIPGETLQQRIDRTGPLELMDMLSIGRQIAEGLAAAHATGLVHRDIKPANVLIENGPQARVKLTDFGLARAADDASMSQSGVVAGTPMYMAPEQARGDALDHRADLFSLGSVLYVMCTGRPPFRASSTLAVLKRVADEQPRPIREIIPEVPEWFCRIVETLHAKNPAERIQTAREVEDVLADCENQFASPRGLTDLSRIPAKRPTPRRGLRLVAALWAFVIFFLATVRYGDPTYRYVTNSASIEFVPADGIESVTVHQDGAPVNPKVPRYGMPSRESIPVSQGQVTVVPTLAPGHVVDHWDILTEGFRPGRVFWKGFRTARVQRPGDVPLTFTVERGLRVTVSAVTRVLPFGPPKPPPATDDVVPLFNGKDLTGWNAIPPRNWRVENGVIKGTGPDGFLFSDVGEYEDFHLSAEYRINANGDAGIHFRLPPPKPERGARWGYTVVGPEAQVSVRKEAGYRTGAITVQDPPRSRVLAESSIPPHAADEWMRMELIARKDRIQILVNGKLVTDYTDPESKFRRGHIALATWEGGGIKKTEVEFRKVEVRILPETAAKASDNFVPLFNGKDLTGWKTHPDQPGDWKVEEGVLVGRGGPSHLFTRRDSYGDFRLRAQVKINATGDSGIWFRTPFDLPTVSKITGLRYPGGAEAQIYCKPGGDEDGKYTGSLGREAPNLTALHQPDQWFDLEIVTRGDLVTTSVNGLKAAERRLPPTGTRSGHIALQSGGSRRTTVVHFRNIEIQELPAEPVADGFVPLFNGIDLTGWKQHPNARGDWSVTNGTLVGRAGGQPSYLFSKSDAYANFHLRVEAQVNERAESGVYGRSKFQINIEPVSKEPLVEGGYEAQLCVRPLYPIHTGSIVTRDGRDFPRVAVADHRADEWVVLEVIADGNRMQTLVNGKSAKEYVDPQARFARGHLVLQTANPGGVVRFRKIEIRELAEVGTSDTNEAVLKPLRDLVAAKQKSRDMAKVRENEGILTPLQTLPAEVELLEARIRLAQAERNQSHVVELLESLVTQRLEEKRLTGILIESGVLRAGEMNGIDARVAEARLRLAEARKSAPKP